LGRSREDFAWLKPNQTALVTDYNQTRWWTFGGLLANSAIAGMLRNSGVKIGRANNLAVPIEDRAAAVGWDQIMDGIAEFRITKS
jgi:hypothetical protein